MQGYSEYELGDLLEYEQPTAYIVESTDYSDSYSVPVLTAGKSFILGYTNEMEGVFDKTPVIIFDDFTTATQYVNFPFKVKSSAMKILHINKDLVLPKYIYYRIQIIQFDHSTHKRYWIQQYSKIRVSIPPIPEQERIVARIEELFSQLDAGVETLKKTKAQLAVYRQAVLKEAFENISTYVPLSDVCQRVFDGPFGSNLKTSDYVSCGVRVVRLENLKNMWFDDSKQSFIANEKYELIASHTVFPTDLIMSTFISDSIKVCRLPNYIEYAVNKADCVGIRLSDNVNPDFVMFWLSSKEAYNRLSHQIHGATRPRVNTKQIKALQIPSVKKEVQDKIVSVIQEKFSVCDNIEQTINIALQQAEAMRQSILKDAFEGRL